MIEKVLSSVKEYNKAVDATPVKARDNEIGRDGWQPPEGGMIKLNSDAAVFPDGQGGVEG